MRICIKSCYEELQNALEYNKIKLTDLPCKLHIVRGKSKKCVCSECGEEIKYGEYYLKDNYEVDAFVESAIEELGNIISCEIETCSHCEGDEVEYYVNRYNYEFAEDGLKIESKGRSIEDLFFDYCIPQQFYDNVLKKVQCQNCNYGAEPYHPKHNPDGGNFELDDRVYTRQEIYDFWGINIHELQKLGRKYGIIFEDSEFQEFQEFLWIMPMLGFKHDTGKKIYDLLNNIYNNIECEILNSESILYRGRTRKEDRPAFKDNEMWNPPDGITSHGRYNQIGISVLYCSTKQKVLPYEIHAGLDDIVEIVKFKLKENMKILDVDDVFEEFDGFFNSNYVESKELKKKYLLPNYIRDCCKDIGYNGIAYRSVHDDSCKNYALINFKEDINIELISHTYKKFKVCYRSQRINT